MPLAFNARDGGIPLGDLHKILHRGQRMPKVKNDKEILPNVSAPSVGRTNITDNRRIYDSKDPNVT